MPALTRRVLIVEDQIGDLLWLIDILHERGYQEVVATNERDARQRLFDVKAGRESYALAIIDVMVAIMDLDSLIALDEKFFENSRDTGIRICRFARKELKLSASALPIVCLTARDDDDVKTDLRALGVRYFNRSADRRSSQSIVTYIEEHLPSLEP